MNKNRNIYFLTLFFVIGCFSGNKDDFYKATDFTAEHEFTKGIEGPAVDHEGILYAVNFKSEGTIGMITPDGVAQLYVDLPQGSVGNGIRFNKNGDMFVADYTAHNILKIDAKTKSISVFAHDSTMNQPNDIAIMDNGILFASDPNWKNNSGKLWKINTEGIPELLEQQMGTSNGIEVSPDNKTLYVNESVQRKIWKYRIDKSGNISDKQLFASFDDFGLDGMRCDADGNLYVCRYGKGSVAKFSPKGKLLNEIQLKGEKVSNIAFGGYDGRTCYVTLAERGCIETFRVETAGRAFGLK